VDSLFSDVGVVEVISTIVGVVLTAVLGLLFKDTAKRFLANKILDLAIPILAHVVSEVSKHTKNKVDDVIADVLERMAETMKAKNLPPAPAKLEQAREVLSQLHAESKALEAK
jgi:predicted nucleotidyltransferase